MSVNQDKLKRVRDNLTARQRDLVDVLPLLFHANHPKSPGYVSKKTPAGICDYTPERKALLAIKRIAMSFRPAPGSPGKCVIKGLYLMGSPGTVGYSKTSDLDIWLVHDPGLAESEVAELKAKTLKIEAYAAGIDLEMHFFVFDAVRFREGETLSLSDESSGSSQHYLLLDEFYRSGLLLAGLKPLWWCVPPQDEHRYEEYVDEAIRSRRIAEHDYVDFGGLANVPADEFFGAAVWHLYKSIDSPYKSVLKLLLMETYASEYPSGQLLSQRYKEALGRDKVSINELDPYILMYRKVEEYLTGQNDAARLDLMRRSFYIKADVCLSSSKETRVPDWQRRMLHELTVAWNWSEADTRHLDNRGQWKIPFASQERRGLIKALRQSYAALSKFAKEHEQDQKITQTDLNILGRKLYAAFEKKPSKIDIVTRGICPHAAERELSLYCSEQASGQPQWMLYSGVVTPDQAIEKKPLAQASSPAELLAWCHFNHMIDRDTTWRVHDPKQRLTLTDLRKAIDAMNDNYPNGTIKAPGAKALENTPRPLAALAMINLGVDPVEGKMQAGGILTSNRTDAFQFGGQRINLVRSVDLLMMTSWEEMFVFHFEGATALVDAVTEYLQWATPLGSFTPPEIKVCTLSKDYAHPISQRVESYANKLVENFCEESPDTDRQHIVQIEESYCRAFVKNGKPHYEFHENHAGLIKSLGNPKALFSDIEFDAGCSGVDVLKCIFAKNRADVIQLFVLERAGEADVYALDEFGALFTHRQECYRVEMILDQYVRFMQNLVKNHPQDIATAEQFLDDRLVELYRLQPQAHDAYLALQVPTTLQMGNDYLSLRVFVDTDGAGNQQFTVFCEDEEFSSVEHGGRLFVSIAEHILARRGKNETYPIYITDLELSIRFKNQRGIDNQQTIHLLNYKKRIERQLTRALQHDLSAGEKIAAAM